jgi:hypothetical protein
VRYDAVTWVRAEQLKADGVSDYEIGRQLGIPRSTGYNHFARSGRPRRPAPGRRGEDAGGSDAAALIVLGLFLVLLRLDYRARKGKWSRGTGESRAGRTPGASTPTPSLSLPNADRSNRADHLPAGFGFPNG